MIIFHYITIVMCYNNILFIHKSRSLGEIVMHLATLINSGDTFDMIVRRGYILSDAIKRLDRLSFDASKKIIVLFVISLSV